MGQDKAGLMIEGQPLWRRQWSKLEALGASELFISGKADAPYALEGRETIEDPVSNAGPMSGFVAALRLIRDEWLWDALASPGAIPRHLLKLRNDLKFFILPERRDRTNPRAVKLKMSNYPRKRPSPPATDEPK